ncbi:MAG: KTSC domain-containing protein [Burkholderiales bacterium]|nr:KTSC domain-containing protein [Burkholderiales bacterium]
MHRKPLKSSKLRAAGYDERERTLEIEFVNGDVFAYQGVSPEIHRQLMASPSPNSFFEDKIEEAFSGKRIGKVSRSDAAADFDALFGGKSNDA